MKFSQAKDSPLVRSTPTLIGRVAAVSNWPRESLDRLRTLEILEWLEAHKGLPLRVQKGRHSLPADSVCLYGGCPYLVSEWLVVKD